ncbi:hypothetical protein EJ110_NYTH41217 [Nymphaea thermarum]|nr:hypothetical protein EJ110_NYTH41217 [Nymphaea thermarum]
MVELALPARTSPLFVSDRGNVELGQNGGCLRARIVCSGALRKENPRNLGFLVNCRESRKTGSGHGGIRVCKGKFRPNEHLRFLDWGQTAEISARHHGHGRSVPCNRSFCSGDGISYMELEKFGRLNALEKPNSGTSVRKIAERNRGLWCLGPKNVHCAYSRIPALGRFGRFGRADYEMGFDFEPEAGNTLDNSSARSRLNRRNDDGIMEGEQYDFLDHAFDQKFKRGSKNNENFNSLFINEESLGYSGTKTSVNYRTAMSSMVPQGNDGTLDSEKISDGGSVDQLQKGKSGIIKNTLKDEDDLLPVDRDLLQLRREMQQDENLVKKSESNDLVGGESTTGTLLEDEEMGSLVNRGLHGGKQVLRRSNVLAKQVISIQSALSLGFVSQLWVDVKSWMVLVVEVRPSLLSGEMERFLLKDIFQVGDVVLVQDESVIENDLRLIGLETLVGYNVITESCRTVGKVRGYTFNINSGSIESLELDSFGVSIIPASLVSTYCLFVEDVLEVLSDTIVVQEGAASRIQRLTKGFWGNQKIKAGDHDDENELDIRLAQRQRRTLSRSRARRFSSRKEGREDWDFPLDY